MKQIRTECKDVKSAAVGSDCAFSSCGKCFSAVSPVALDISEGGYYAVYKAVNALVAQGISPDHFTLSVLLPADAQEPQLKTIVKDALTAAGELKVAYAGGHTEVTTAVLRPVITASAVGYADDTASRPCDGAGDAANSAGAANTEGVTDTVGAAVIPTGLYCAKPMAGQALVVTKWIALEGTAILAGERRDELITRYPAPFIDDAISFGKMLDIRPEMQAVADVMTAAGPGNCKCSDDAGDEESDVRALASVHDISSGGIFAALWEMAERGSCGLEVDLKSIPIRQETIEVCEFLEVNPYLLTSAGALLIACDDGEALVGELERRGINAAVIGCLREGNDRIIRNDDERRFLEMPQADELVRVLS